MRPAPAALALAVLVLALAGCTAAPKPLLGMALESFSVAAAPARNQTIINAQIRLTAEGGDLVNRDVMIWAQDPSRGLLMVGDNKRHTLKAGESTVVNFSQSAAGFGYPLKFLAHGLELAAEVWPNAANLTYPMLSKEGAGNGTWGYPTPFSLNRQRLHVEVDNTAVGLPPGGRVEGTLRITIDGREEVQRRVALDPGQHRDHVVVSRTDERVEVTWTGPPVDILVYVGDTVHARYLLEAGPGQA